MLGRTKMQSSMFAKLNQIKAEILIIVLVFFLTNQRILILAFLPFITDIYSVGAQVEIVL